MSIIIMSTSGSMCAQARAPTPSRDQSSSSSMRARWTYVPSSVLPHTSPSRSDSKS